MRLWSVAAYLFLPYALVSLIWRGLRYPAYLRRLSERFGFGPGFTADRVIWVHAVSVGEVRSSAALIEALAERMPRHRVLVTTMTPTGAEQVQMLFGDRVLHSYLPYDFPDAVRRFLKRFQPELAIIAETEFWPNLFHACVKRSIPLNVVNARLSPDSFRRYSLVPRTVRRMFQAAERICAQSPLDAQRFRNLGVEHQPLTVTGNLKFDVALPDAVHEQGRAFRRQWGVDRSVLIAASTHPGEEAAILAVHANLLQRFPDLLLVLAPRHPERFGSVARLCRRSGFETWRRTSLNGELPATSSALVADTMGELQMFYAAADIAVIGGSFVRHGGQNPLEAFAVGVPAIFGPHMFHFEEITALSLERGAARQVSGPEMLTRAIALYLEQPALRRAAGAAAISLVHENRGALERTLTALDRRLSTVAGEAQAGIAANLHVGG